MSPLRPIMDDFGHFWTDFVQFNLGISWAHFWHISVKYQTTLKNISGISQVYFRYISDASQAYHMYIPGISQQISIKLQANLKDINGIFHAYCISIYINWTNTTLLDISYISFYASMYNPRTCSQVVRAQECPR